MSIPWSNAPVFYVLAHVQFNAIPVMEKYAAEIADLLRRAGYSDIQDDKQSVVTFGMAMDGSPTQKVEQRDVARWRISNREKTAGFLLLQDALIYHTTQYQERGSFFNELLEGLKIVHGVVGLDYIERIGLRYLNAVMPTTGETISQYIQPEAQGLSGKFDEGLLHSMVETVAQLSCGTLISRALTVKSQSDYPPLPPELLPLPLVIQNRFSSCNGIVTVLDNDCFLDSRIEYSVPVIEEALYKLREGISVAFENTITPFAKEQWK